MLIFEKVKAGLCSKSNLQKQRCSLNNGSHFEILFYIYVLFVHFVLSYLLLCLAAYRCLMIRKGNQNTDCGLGGGGGRGGMIKSFFQTVIFLDIFRYFLGYYMNVDFWEKQDIYSLNLPSWSKLGAFFSFSTCTRIYICFDYMYFIYSSKKYMWNHFQYIENVYLKEIKRGTKFQNSF